MTRKGRKKGPPELRSTIKRQGDVIHGGLQGETHVTSSRHDTHCVGPLYYFALETYLTLQGCECIFIILTEVVNLRDRPSPLTSAFIPTLPLQYILYTNLSRNAHKNPSKFLLEYVYDKLATMHLPSYFDS